MACKPSHGSMRASIITVGKRVHEFSQLLKVAVANLQTWRSILLANSWEFWSVATVDSWWIKWYFQLYIYGNHDSIGECVASRIVCGHSYVNISPYILRLRRRQGSLIWTPNTARAGLKSDLYINFIKHISFFALNLKTYLRYHSTALKRDESRLWSCMHI